MKDIQRMDVNAIRAKINSRIYWTIYKYNRFRSVVEWNICACAQFSVCIFDLEDVELPIKSW